MAWYGDNSGRNHLDSTSIENQETRSYVQRLEDNGNGMHEVAQKRANGFGLHDMLGNVWEWVNDWFDAKYYQISPSRDPPGPASSPYGADPLRVIRGGGWDTSTKDVRLSVRGWGLARFGNEEYGFRCAQDGN
jgi:formylglycine-generating enzyme required for sulfatase activity